MVYGKGWRHLSLLNCPSSSSRGPALWCCEAAAVILHRFTSHEGDNHNLGISSVPSQQVAGPYKSGQLTPSLKPNHVSRRLAKSVIFHLAPSRTVPEQLFSGTAILNTETSCAEETLETQKSLHMPQESWAVHFKRLDDIIPTPQRKR